MKQFKKILLAIILTTFVGFSFALGSASAAKIGTANLNKVGTEFRITNISQNNETTFDGQDLLGLDTVGAMNLQVFVYFDTSYVPDIVREIYFDEGIPDGNGVANFPINSIRIIGDEGIEFISADGDGSVVYRWDRGQYDQDHVEAFVIVVKDVPEFDGKEPVISGQTTFIANVDEKPALSTFTSKLSAFDETDGDVTNSMVVTVDNYTANRSVLGNHTVTVTFKDLSNNVASAVINIRVVDITIPVLVGNTAVVKIGYKETYNIENYRKTITVTDNYDTLTNAAVTVKTDGYTTNKTKLGTYNIVFAAKDSSGNEGTLTKPLQVYDNVKPTISGPTTIATSNTTILTESDVRAKLTANDEIDGNITSKIVLVEDNYTGKGNKVGNYTIKYSVTDNAGNSQNHTVTINRTDKIPPVIYVENGYTIRTNATTPISYDIIIDILVATGQVQTVSATTFNFLLDEYTGNESTEGIYAMSVQARSTNGSESVHNMSIVVTDEFAGEDLNTRPGNNWLDNNKDILIYGAIGLVAAVGIGYMVLNKSKKKGRR